MKTYYMPKPHKCDYVLKRNKDDEDITCNSMATRCIVFREKLSDGDIFSEEEYYCEEHWKKLMRKNTVEMIRGLQKVKI